MQGGYGSDPLDSALLVAIKHANAAGQLFVAAAGNDDMNNDYYYNVPASFPSLNILAVAASDHFDDLTDFTNYGQSVLLAAPGSYILSTVPGNRQVTCQHQKPALQTEHAVVAFMCVSTITDPNYQTCYLCKHACWPTDCCTTPITRRLHVLSHSCSLQWTSSCVQISKMDQLCLSTTLPSGSLLYVRR